MLTKVAIKNFKSLRDVQIDLERFTVFVGPNASGKSSILQALNWLSRSQYAFDQVLCEALFRLKSYGANSEVLLTGHTDQLSYRCAPTSAGELLRSLGENASYQVIREYTASPGLFDWMPWQMMPGEMFPISHSTLLRLDPAKLVNSDTRDDDITTMSSDGTGLHVALANMALNDPDTWQKLQSDICRLTPTIRRLRHTRTSPKRPPMLLFDTTGAESLAATQVSEGTILVLGLLTALHGADTRSLMLLDDLDRGLHPKAQRELIKLLRTLLRNNPALQIVATTHSPYMLDSIEPKEVRMTLLRDDGTTVCSALAQHPQFEKWKDEMTPGEMWSLFGEKWLVEGATA